MVSIDFRTRQAGDEVVLEPGAFLDEYAAALPGVSAWFRSPSTSKTSS